MNGSVSVIAQAISVLLITGCTTGASDFLQPKPRPLYSELAVYEATAANAHGVSNSDKIQNPTGELSLEKALSLALLQNHHLASFSWQAKAKEGLRRQASLLPNPELAVEIENFAGSDDNSEFDSTESTLWISQPLELGEKRAKRTQVASLEQAIASWEYETKRLDVIMQTTVAFIDTLAAQEQLLLAEETFRLSEQVLDTVTRRVQAGKVSPLEETKASVTYATSKIEVDTAGRNLRSARKRLVSMWGALEPCFEKAGGNIYAIAPTPCEESVIGLAVQNPDIARWDVELNQRRAVLELEDSRRIPDLTLSGGVRRFEETDDYAFVFGASLPLPLTNRNQGNILEAQSLFAKAEQERSASEIAVHISLAESYENLSRSYAEAFMLKDEVLPAAQLAFDAAQKGYQEGKFGFLEVLDAQRTLFDARRQHVEAAAQYQKLRATVERLIGQKLGD